MLSYYGKELRPYSLYTRVYVIHKLSTHEKNNQ